MPNSSSRTVFTAAVLLLLLAGLEAWVAYSGADLVIGAYHVPGAFSWFAAGTFAVIGLFTMRAAHVTTAVPVLAVE